jgi:hypothetical protein
MTGKGKFLQDVGDGVFKDIDENPLQVRIKDLEEGKGQSRQKISENEKNIDTLDQEIRKLRDLELRLKKIFWVKNYKDLGSALQVSLLVNKTTIRDFVEHLNYLLESNFQFSQGQSMLADLTVFQGLFLLFSNELSLSELDSNKPLNEPEDPKSENPAE